MKYVKLLIALLKRQVSRLLATCGISKVCQSHFCH